MIGMAMNTMKVSDMTSAISRPENRSRTTEVAMTRVLAAPSPWMKRSASRIAKFGAKVAAKAQIDIDARCRPAAAPRRPKRSVSGPKASCGDAEAEHVGADDELALVLVRDAERLAHIGQGRQHDVDGERVERHQRRHKGNEFGAGQDPRGK